jgi:hypothetical protein
MNSGRKKNCSVNEPATPKGADNAGNLHERSSVFGEIEKLLSLDAACMQSRIREDDLSYRFVTLCVEQ